MASDAMLRVMYSAFGSLVEARGLEAKMLLARESWCGKLFNAAAVSAARGAPTAASRLSKRGRRPRAQMLYKRAGWSKGPNARDWKRRIRFVDRMCERTPSTARDSARAGIEDISRRKRMLSSPYTGSPDVVS